VVSQPQRNATELTEYTVLYFRASGVFRGEYPSLKYPSIPFIKGYGRDIIGL
jgi:hypothetical protein